LYVDYLLQVLVLAIVENWVVDDDTVDGIVVICGQDGFLDVVAGNFAEGVFEATSTLLLMIYSF